MISPPSSQRAQCGIAATKLRIAKFEALVVQGHREKNEPLASLKAQRTQSVFIILADGDGPSAKAT
jgi:hypothetical protein